MAQRYKEKSKSSKFPSLPREIYVILKHVRKFSMHMRVGPYDNMKYK